jgi:hypothetical protein
MGLIVCGLVLLLAANWGVRAEERERDLSGTWKLQGWNMGSDPKGKADYDGEVIVEHKGKQTYELAWKIDGNVVNTGVGLYDARTDTFAGGYAIQNQPGVAIWQFSEDGTVMSCVGTFKGAIGDIAWERWSRE